MMARQRPALATVFLTVMALVAACNGASGPLGSVPPVPSSPAPSVAQGSPDLTPAPSIGPSEQPSSQPSGPTPSPSQASPAPTASPSGTTIVRSYFWLGGQPNSDGLVAVLREIPATKSVATAAMNALLAGPNALESSRSISSAVPDGSQLLGLTIAGGVATVDLSSEFEAGGGSSSVLTRYGQVVYTLTQFPTVKSVLFEIEDQPRSVFSADGTELMRSVARSDFVTLLPTMWVDRPAWGAAIGNPAHVTGSADVFEATFRIAILDASGKVIADQPVMATCGSGCRGTFDTTVAYTVAKGQYGTLRVYEPSAKDGTPQDVRDYRAWLTPQG